MGASDVVALSPEGTLSFGRSVLDRLGVAAGRTEAIVGSLKLEDYAALRGNDDADSKTAAQGFK